MNEFMPTLSDIPGAPLYERLYRSILGEIHSGRLAKGARLPSKRSICQHLAISRSTVETALGMLLSEGYLSSAPRSGYFVAATLKPAISPAPIQVPADAQKPAKYDFSTSAVDTSLFPYATWARFFREALSGDAAFLERGAGQGDYPLRQALCSYLYEYRGIDCIPEQIVIGAGMEYLCELALMLIRRDATVALEDPGYDVPYRIMRNNSRPVRPVPLDENGIDAEYLARTDASIAYVTPAHQFPTGVRMPLSRRARLLAWAEEAPDRYIIEDDYDDDFQYGARPVPSLFGLDGAGQVMHIATFSRSIAPSFRAAYLVIPRCLTGRYEAMFGASSCTVSRLDQYALTRFIEGGFYARHLRRMKKLYRTRLNRLTSLLHAGGLEVSGGDAGLHILITCPRLSEVEMLARATQAGITLKGLSAFSHFCPVRPSTVVAGYAGLKDDQLDEAAGALLRAWE